MEEHKISHSESTPLNTSKISLYFGDHFPSSLPASFLNLEVFSSGEKKQEHFLYLNRQIKTKYEIDLSLVLEFNIVKQKRGLFIETLNYFFKNDNPRTSFVKELQWMLEVEEIFIDYFENEEKFFLIFRLGKSYQSQISQKVSFLSQLSFSFFHLTEKSLKLSISSLNTPKEILATLLNPSSSHQSFHPSCPPPPPPLSSYSPPPSSNHPSYPPPSSLSHAPPSYQPPPLSATSLGTAVFQNLKIELETLTGDGFAKEFLNLLEILELIELKSNFSFLLSKIKSFDISLIFNSTEILVPESKRDFLRNFLNEDFLGCEKEDEKHFLNLFEIIGEQFDFYFTVMEMGCMKGRIRLPHFKDIFKFYSYNLGL